MRPRTHRRLPGLFWLLALAPYATLALTSCLPHCHEIIAAAPGSAVPHLAAAPQAHHADCPLCQWQAASKASPSAPSAPTHVAAPVCAAALVALVVALPAVPLSYASRAPPAAI